MHVNMSTPHLGEPNARSIFAVRHSKYLSLLFASLMLVGIIEPPGRCRTSAIAFSFLYHSSKLMKSFLSLQLLISILY